MIFPDEIYPCHTDTAGAASPVVLHIHPGSEGSNPLPVAFVAAQIATQVAAYLAVLSLSGFLLGLLLLLGAAEAEQGQLGEVWGGFTNLLGRGEIPQRPRKYRQSCFV